MNPNTGRKANTAPTKAESARANHRPFNAQDLQQQKVNLRAAAPIPKPLQLTPHGVNADMLRQAKGKLTPTIMPKDEQRYMVSPHKDVNNFVNNARGMGQLAVRDGMKPVRPVFKNDDQRSSFHAEVNKRLSAQKQTTKNDQHNYNALSQLSQWSSPKNAMMNFDNVDKRKSHPIVYTQGHGSAGDKKIYSDDPNEKGVRGRKVAKQLKDMGLPKASEVRANSCYSGTQHEINDSANLSDHLLEGSVASNHAGKWSKTFAGNLQKGLKQQGYENNRVRGYMGPTSQGFVDVKGPSVDAHMRADHDKDKHTMTSQVRVQLGSIDVQRKLAARHGQEHIPSPPPAKKK